MADNNGRQALVGYSLFDFANSAFTLIFHAYLFPLYLQSKVFAGGDTRGQLVWGILLSSSALAAAVTGPFLGRAADYFGKWRVFALVASASFLTAGISAASIGGKIEYVLGAFFLASACFYLAANLYDSLLGQVADISGRPAFSGFAWGFGYLGGVVCFIVVYKLQGSFGIASTKPYLFTALFYTLFGLLSLAILKRPVGVQMSSSRVSFRKMLAGLTKQRIRLLLGYLLIADMIGAIIAFTAIYASNELHLTTEAIGGFLLVVQILAFPMTYIVCRIAVRTGIVTVLKFCAAVWISILILFVVRVNVMGMWVVVVLTSLVIGSTQALLRSQYSQLVLWRRESEQFGWYGIATESATIAAPILFGVSAFFFGGQRYAMGLLIIPLVVGFLLVFKYSSDLDFTDSTDKHIEEPQRSHSY